MDASGPSTGHHNSGARFRLRCWGARGSIPSPGPKTIRYGGHTTCVEVRTHDDDLIVLDAGTGLRALGQSLGTPVTPVRPAAPVQRSAVDANDAGVSAVPVTGEAPHHDQQTPPPAHLFLTHHHSDHVIGLPHFAPLFDQQSVLYLTGGAADVSETRAVLDTLLSPPLFPPLPALSERLVLSAFSNGSPVEVGARYTVHRFPARHPGGAAIFRLDDSKGPAIGFAPDNELSYADRDPDVVAWRRGLTLALHGVPILLHDAMYTDSELTAHRGWGHSSALEATRFAMECVAGMLVLFHHHPDRSDDAIDAIVQECRQLVSLSGSSLRVLAAWEGLTLTV